MGCLQGYLLMKKTVLAAFAASMAFSAPANAADLDQQIGLIVSGVVDQWAGVQFFDAPSDDSSDDVVMAQGGEGRLSMPLGENFSVQGDVKYEYNSLAFEPRSDIAVVAPRYSFQGTAHMSWRDPNSFLFGAFGGAGGADTSFVGRYDISYIGGEAQVYLDNITLYGQGGFIDFDVRTGVGGVRLDDGLFARGVLRYFMADGSRLQLEGTYLNADYAFSAGEMEAFSVKARYDFDINLPIAGSTPLYVAYRGTFRDSCYFGRDDVDDHTIMIGTSYSFSGDRIAVDRRGATLDTPDFNHACIGATGGGGVTSASRPISQLSARMPVATTSTAGSTRMTRSLHGSALR